MVFLYRRGDWVVGGAYCEGAGIRDHWRHRVIGIVGAMLGGWMARVIGVSTNSSIAFFLLALIGAVVLVGLTRFFVRKV